MKTFPNKAFWTVIMVALTLGIGQLKEGDAGPVPQMVAQFSNHHKFHKNGWATKTDASWTNRTGGNETKALLEINTKPLKRNPSKCSGSKLSGSKKLVLSGIIVVFVVTGFFHSYNIWI